eukprot:8971719-Pyramimonas_sp.AAC.1
MTRAGWSVCSLRPGTEEVEAVGYGPVPGLVQSSGLAEHYAFLMALTLVPARATIVADHKNLLLALEKGPEVKCSPTQPHWEIWRQIFWKNEDFGSENVDL